MANSEGDGGLKYHQLFMGDVSKNLVNYNANCIVCIRVPPIFMTPGFNYELFQQCKRDFQNIVIDNNNTKQTKREYIIFTQVKKIEHLQNFFLRNNDSGMVRCQVQLFGYAIEAKVGQIILCKITHVKQQYLQGVLCQYNSIPVVIYIRVAQNESYINTDKFHVSGNQELLYSDTGNHVQVGSILKVEITDIQFSKFKESKMKLNLGVKALDLYINNI